MLRIQSETPPCNCTVLRDMAPAYCSLISAQNTVPSFPCNSRSKLTSSSCPWAFELAVPPAWNVPSRPLHPYLTGHHLCVGAFSYFPNKSVQACITSLKLLCISLIVRVTLSNMLLVYDWLPSPEQKFLEAGRACSAHGRISLPTTSA